MNSTLESEDLWWNRGGEDVKFSAQNGKDKSEMVLQPSTNNVIGMKMLQQESALARTKNEILVKMKQRCASVNKTTSSSSSSRPKLPQPKNRMRFQTAYQDFDDVAADNEVEKISVRKCRPVTSQEFGKMASIILDGTTPTKRGQKQVSFKETNRGEDSSLDTKSQGHFETENVDKAAMIPISMPKAVPKPVPMPAIPTPGSSPKVTDKVGDSFSVQKLDTKSESKKMEPKEPQHGEALPEADSWSREALPEPAAFERCPACDFSLAAWPLVSKDVNVDDGSGRNQSKRDKEEKKARRKGWPTTKELLQLKHAKRNEVAVYEELYKGEDYRCVSNRDKDRIHQRSSPRLRRAAVKKHRPWAVAVLASVLIAIVSHLLS